MSEQIRDQQYEVIQCPTIDPLSAIETIVNRGLSEYYWVYGSDSETIIALDAIGQVVVDKDWVRSNWDGKIIATEDASDPFEQVGRLLNDMPLSNWRAFGHIAFDVSGYYLPYPFQAPASQMRFTIPKTELVISDRGTTIRTLEEPQPITSALQSTKSYPHSAPNAPTQDISDRESYEQKVAELLEFIHDNQLTKAILARRINLPGSIDIFSTFDSISRNNPAARTYGFKQEDLSGIGSSPELLMQTNGNGLIVTNPLAGTRPRGSSPQEDERLRKELQNDTKENKEHVMSVRLAQEELESVCSLGSVSIINFMQVAPFRTVQHLASTLNGQLAAGRTLWDGLRALFPGVTVSGIDKSSAVERIASLEQMPRGPYAGCVGWVNSKGASDLAISLRSAFEDRNGVSVSAGAGIVAESLPNREYEETYYKMQTMLSKLVLSGVN